MKDYILKYRFGLFDKFVMMLTVLQCLNSRLQRYFRDIHVAKSHIMVSPATLETIGGLFFGLDLNVSML